MRYCRMSERALGANTHESLFNTNSCERCQISGKSENTCNHNTDSSALATATHLDHTTTSPMKTKHTHSTHTEGPNPKAIHFEAGCRILATNQPRG